MASSQTLVLDLDETLISSVTDGSPPVGDYYLLASNCWCRKRPYLDEFLAYAGRRFDDIGLWSAGRKSYVDSVVNALDLPTVRAGLRLPPGALRPGRCPGDRAATGADSWYRRFASRSRSSSRSTPASPGITAGYWMIARTTPPRTCSTGCRFHRGHRAPSRYPSRTTTSCDWYSGSSCQR